MTDKYEDIINLEHVTSQRHARMSVRNRAAQFAPFAALIGFDDEIEETGRYTDVRIEQDENAKDALDERMQILVEYVSQHPKVRLTYFVPDMLKSGGSYRTETGNLKKIDEYERKIVMMSGNEIPIDDIFSLESDIFRMYGIDVTE